MRAEPKAIWFSPDRTKLLLTAMTVDSTGPYQNGEVIRVWKNHVYMRIA